MQITAKQIGNTAHAALAGELDQHTAQDVREQLDALFDAGAKHMVIDMKELTMMDSSGIGVLIGRYKRALAGSGTLAVKNPTAQIDAIMRMAGLYKIIRRA